MAVAGVQAVTVFNHPQGDEIGSRSRASTMVQMWREMEDEYRSSTGMERRQEREWPQGEASRGNRREWLGEMEQERVRVIRAWVHLTSQQREPAGRIEQVLDGLVGSRKGIQRLCGRQALMDMLKKTQRERRIEIAKLAERRAVSQFPHRLRIQSVLRGRFLRNSGDRIAGEVALSKRRCSASSTERERGVVVSKFDNMATKKESRNDTPRSARVEVPVSVVIPASEAPCVETETVVPVSDAAITGTFERTTSIESVEDRFRSETDEAPPEISVEFQGQYSNLHSGDQVETSESENGEEVSVSANSSTNLDRFFLTISPMASCELLRNGSGDSQDLEGHYSNLHYDCRTDTSMSEKEEDASEISCRHSEQFFLNITPLDTFRVPENSQSDEQYDTREGEYVSVNSCRNRPMNTDDFRNEDRANTSELRELLNRRSVSTLLNSSFSRILNEVLQAHIEREKRKEEEATSAGAGRVTRGGYEMINVEEHDWDAIVELREDMERLHERINGMQRMVEACMGMQLKLQESISREMTAGAWSERDRMFDHVRRGVCCLCQTATIDSLLYRCGHMCTCLSCANELISSDGKCPMCWASVAQVFRANSL